MDADTGNAQPDNEPYGGMRSQCIQILLLSLRMHPATGGHISCLYPGRYKLLSFHSPYQQNGSGLRSFGVPG